MKFKNPTNNHTESAYSPLSWLWVLLFGPIYWAVRGVWRHAVVHFFVGLLGIMLSPLTLFISAGVSLIVHILYAAFCFPILNKHYMRMGWQPVKSDEKKNKD